MSFGIALKKNKSQQRASLLCIWAPNFINLVSLFRRPDLYLDILASSGVTRSGNQAFATNGQLQGLSGSTQQATTPLVRFKLVDGCGGWLL